MPSSSVKEAWLRPMRMLAWQSGADRRLEHPCAQRRPVEWPAFGPQEYHQQTMRVSYRKGRGRGGKVMRPEPFTVSIPAVDLDDLRGRLAATRWADDFGNEDWAYGVERGWLEGMIAYWAGEFDWRAQEEAMNCLPQFRVELDGLLVHYVYVRSSADDPIPLLLTHGWPWTFWDYKDMIVPLTEAGFDVVVPSLPGSGLLAAPSDGSRYRGHRREMGWR